MKCCKQCGITKPLGDFYRHAKMADGHLNKCKECVKARVRAHREANLERIQAYDRRRGCRQTAEQRRAIYKRRKSAVITKLRADRTREPDKYQARNAISNAIRDGKLQRPLYCDLCLGNSEHPIHAHHHDYGQPFDVTWVCTMCHGLLHRRYADAPLPVPEIDHARP